jgi:hyperosmotically inducible periplasmic protein
VNPQETPEEHLMKQPGAFDFRTASNIVMKLTVLTLASAVAIAGSAWSQDPNADNTGKNVRDRGDQSETATDQSNDPADIKMTAAIRKMVVGDGSLSTMAKNVKIITVGGAVTLRGPVETEKEKAAIESHAKQAGAKNISNELEIKKS